MSDQLTINWPYLLVAIAMLWFPRQWLRTGVRVLKKRRKPDGALERLAGMGARDPDDKSVQAGREFANFRNYVDLFRALAGGYSLAQFAFTTGDGAQAVFLIEVAVLLVGVLIQGVRYDERLNFFAPIFYLVGMAVGTCGESSADMTFTLGNSVGLFAFVLVLAINPVIPNPRMFLTAYGLLLLPFGYVFDTDLKMLGLNASLILLLPLLSLMTKRPLIIFSRKAKPASTPS